MKKVALYVGIAAVVGLVWFSSTSTTLSSRVEPELAGDACLRAFEKADTTQSTWSDLFPALNACKSLEGWSYASAMYADAPGEPDHTRLNVVSLCLQAKNDLGRADQGMCNFVEVTEERKHELIMNLD